MLIQLIHVLSKETISACRVTYFSGCWGFCYADTYILLLQTVVICTDTWLGPREISKHPLVISVILFDFNLNNRNLISLLQPNRRLRDYEMQDSVWPWWELILLWLSWQDWLVVMVRCIMISNPEDQIPKLTTCQYDGLAGCRSQVYMHVCVIQLYSYLCMILFACNLYMSSAWFCKNADTDMLCIVQLNWIE